MGCILCIIQLCKMEWGSLTRPRDSSYARGSSSCCGFLSHLRWQAAVLPTSGVLSIVLWASVHLGQTRGPFRLRREDKAAPPSIAVSLPSLFVRALTTGCRCYRIVDRPAPAATRRCGQVLHKCKCVTLTAYRWSNVPAPVHELMNQ